MYKRYREESEAARMVWFPFVTLLFAILTTKIGCMMTIVSIDHTQIEEEKELKQMRRTMVPHARPVPNFDNPFCPQKYAFKTETKLAFHFLRCRIF